MSPRVCKAIGYGVSWLGVGIMASFFGVHLFGSMFTTLFLIFAAMALVEGKGATWFDGKFAGSRWQSGAVELVAAVAMYIPVVLILGAIFGLGSFSAPVGFVTLLVSTVLGAVIAVFTGSYLEGFTSGLNRDGK